MSNSRLSLKVWPTGPGFPFPSLNVECLAAITYFQLLWRSSDNAVNWTILSEWDASTSPNGNFPALSCTCGEDITGISSIIDHVQSCITIDGHSDLDSWMDDSQKADCSAWCSQLVVQGTQLLDLYLFVTQENYYSTTRPAYTAFLPLYANYIIPPAHRKAAEARTEHLNIAAMLSTSDDDSSSSKTVSVRSGTADPSASMSEKLGFGARKETLTKAQKRMRLESLTARFFGPLSELLGDKRFFMSNRAPSSLDALALAYLDLILEVKVPDRWAADILEKNYPKLSNWIRREAPHIYGNAPNKS